MSSMQAPLLPTPSTPPTPPARRPPFPRAQRSIVVHGILCLVLVIVVCQLWLFTATMNAFLGGDHGVVWPAAFASLGCLGLNLGLLRFLYRLERP